jgi:hypothetical protein
LLRPVVWWKFSDVSEVLAATVIALMVEAASTSETSVKFYQTTGCNNPEDSHLYKQKLNHQSTRYCQKNK